MNCYGIYSFFIHKLSNAAKVINKGHLRGFSLPNVHYANKSSSFGGTFAFSAIMMSSSFCDFGSVLKSV
ncbi:hypothetical protein CUC00_10130 [Prevotella intermedia]|nr:hypothetical protein CTM44_11945 [Prevotella intermedia]ATV41479.1 hypothetical protein CUC00_10130 [Prevotella intermedia]